ncbi:single-stranded DNA-binding protein [Janibacter cremeus]|uniref:Single-strand DNA-binding protein n=1 Tax=Janibacter cremeus TaxID=1285192 RepID=A0A852W0M8_9MICO|nr:single-stranded DNA-binding protein [Janibacter cremeus]NYF99231.1 single-strand DNA-binding protein [Janibacter cremeus]
MNETELTVAGRLVADPEHRTTRAGVQFTTFRLATNARRRNREGVFIDGPTSYYNVATYRSLGMNSHTSLHKGDPVVVRGRLTINDFQRADESWGSSADIDAYSVGHDLTFGTTEYAKSGRGSDPAKEAAGEGGYTRMKERLEESDGQSWGLPPVTADAKGESPSFSGAVPEEPEEAEALPA